MHIVDEEKEAFCSLRVFCILLCAAKVWRRIYCDGSASHKTHPGIYLFADGKSPAKYHPYFSGVLLSWHFQIQLAPVCAASLSIWSRGLTLGTIEVGWIMALDRDHFQFLHFVCSLPWSRMRRLSPVNKATWTGNLTRKLLYPSITLNCLHLAQKYIYK